jgi:two-component system response regulator YesN
VYHVMIVDDEEPVLDSFTYIMEQGVDKFQLCGKARTGEEAVQLAGILKPDLIFMDIQMPGIDGLEAISRIGSVNEDILFVLATAYERFDLARKAIRLNVLSYLVKPVTRKKILTELERARMILDKRFEDRSKALERSSRSKKRDMIDEAKLVRSLGAPLDKEESLKVKKELGFESERGAFYILLEESDSTLGEKQTHYKRLKEKILFKYLCYLSFSGDRALLFFPEEGDLSGVYTSLKELMRDMSINGHIEQGGIYPLEELMLSYEEAMEPFLLDEEGDNHLYEQEQICRILSLSERGEKQKFRDDMTFLAQTFFSTCTFQMALGKMTAVFFLIMERMGYFSQNCQNSLPFQPAEEIMILENNTQWEAWFHYGLEQITSIMIEVGDLRLPAPLQKAADYIRNHFAEPIYLGSVAQVCGVSASYLSRLFSEHMDCPFTDYLNRCRVERAVELLKGKKFSVKEAANMTGYRDPNYFSKIFRKYKGISPSEV